MKLKIPPRSPAVFEHDGWTLYKRPDDKGVHSFLWQWFKLMRDPKEPAKRGAKRSHGLFWNPVELRFRKDSDSLALERNHPELAAMVELFMSLNYGPDWLASPAGGGYTARQIIAERLRLKAVSAQYKADKAAARIMAAPLSDFE